MGNWNNWNNSYIYTIDLAKSTKVSTLSIIKCDGFSFLVHVWGRL